MSYDEAQLRQSARDRFASWQQGDPRGPLADVPIHFNSEPVTRDLSKGVGKMAEAYAAKRQKVIDAQAAAAVALQKHQDKLAEDAVAAEAKGKEDRATWLATADEKEVGGRRLEKKAGEANYTDVGPATWRPTSQSFYDFSAHNPYGKEDARMKAIDSITANAGKYLGRKTILKGEPMLDSNGQTMMTNDMAGNKIPVLAGKNTDVYVGMAGASPAAQNYFKAGVGIVAAKMVGELTADQAAAKLKEMLPTEQQNPLVPWMTMPVTPDVKEAHDALLQYVYSPSGALPVAPQTTVPLTPQIDPRVKAIMDATGVSQADAEAELKR